MAIAGMIAAGVAIRNMQTVVSLGNRRSNHRWRHKRRPIDYDAVPDCEDPDLPPWVRSSDPPFNQDV